MSFSLSLSMMIKGALDAFHQQFAVYEVSAEVVGPLLPATIATLTLTAGQAATPV
jgi:hypothetical protein